MGARALDRRAEWACLPAGVALGAVTSSVVPLAAGAAAVPLVGRALRRRAERAAAERTAAAVGGLCGALAGDLRAGRPPHAALADAVEAAGWPQSPHRARIARLLLSAARFGGDVPGALRAAARLGRARRAWPRSPPAGRSRWTAARVWPRRSTGWPRRCGRRRTSATTSGPSWRARGPPRGCSRCSRCSGWCWAPGSARTRPRCCCTTPPGWPAWPPAGCWSGAGWPGPPGSSRGAEGGARS